MSVAGSPHSQPARSVVVARLRAAGCVFAEDEAALLMAEAATPAELDALVDQRAAGLPLEHVLGWAELCGIRIAVDPGVFVPRRRTELLVRQAVALIRRMVGEPAARPVVVVDLCCGSGAVGAALVAALTALAADPGPSAGGIELHAVDLDPAAVRCARRNVAALGGQVYEGDLYAPLPATLRGRVDVLVANAPYVPTGELGLLPAEARLHEPREALDGGADGLAVLHRVIADAPGWLAPGGRLLVESSEVQAGEVRHSMARHGLVPDVVSDDDLHARVVVSTTRSTASPPDVVSLG